MSHQKSTKKKSVRQKAKKDNAGVKQKKMTLEQFIYAVCAEYGFHYESVVKDRRRAN